MSFACHFWPLYLFHLNLYSDDCFLLFQSVGLKAEEIIEDEEFFDIATSTSPKGYPKWNPPPAEGKREVPSVKYEVLKEKQYGQSTKPGRTPQGQQQPKTGPRQNKTSGKK